jgi:hypothetical protein
MSGFEVPNTSDFSLQTVSPVPLFSPVSLVSREHRDTLYGYCYLGLLNGGTGARMERRSHSATLERPI